MAETRASQSSFDPELADETGMAQSHRPSPGISRWQKAIGGVGLVVLLWAGDRYYDVISLDGPGGGNMNMDRGPGEQTPTESQDQPAEAPDSQVDPGSGDEEHDPSQFDHG